MHQKLTNRQFTREALLLLVLVALSLPMTGHATSVLSVSIEKILSASELVFEGRVIKHETRATESTEGMISTYITFEIQHLIKGIHPGQLVTLHFLGGSLGDKTFKIAEMQMPAVGERGIYFVESMRRKQVHPLYGWSQGHFIITQDSAGIDRILTNRSVPVIGIHERDPDTAPGLSDGVARGLSLGRDVATRDAISVPVFVSELKAMLQQQHRP